MVILQRTSTVDAIFNLLVERINDRTYKPGDKLPSERLLQKELGVGRLALREALSRTNAMGITITAHGKGTFVQDRVKSATLRDMLIPHFGLTNPKRLQDLVMVRSMVESEIAGLAAEQRTSDDIEELTEITTREFPPEATYKNVAERDLLFHRTLAEIIDNRLLANIHEALIDHIRLFLLEYVKSKSSPKEVMDAHLPILKAIQLGDAKTARFHARQHVSYSRQDYETYISKIS